MEYVEPKIEIILFETGNVITDSIDGGTRESSQVNKKGDEDS